MKFYDQRGNETVVTWLDHKPNCDTCRAVDEARSATFTSACAVGSPLLMEELAKRQAPAEKAKRKEIEDWARDRGVFIKSKVAHVKTKYKE